MDLKALRQSIIDCGRLLWDKDLVTACNGNISVRAGEDRVLVTATGTCLGLLKEEDLVLLGGDGAVLEGGVPSTERHLHLDIYRQLRDVEAVVHTHNPYTNAYFMAYDVFRPATFEAEYVLGDVFSAPQSGVNVKDTSAVIDCLRRSKVAALKRHGTVSVGKTLFECVAKIQTLEEQIKTEAVSRLFRQGV
jgi:L-fuculose-phosphate aldolase